MRQAAPLSMTAAVAAYGSSDTQICRHSAQDRRLRAVQMRCVAERGNGCVAQIVRLALKSVRKI